MGALIDLENVENIYRCNNVKLVIIFIYLIGFPLSLIFLLFCTFKIIIGKKDKTFLTGIILQIFSSEIIQCLSKIIQICKYAFEDERDNKELVDFDNGRGIICQIQIVLSLYSDFCSLLSILLLTLKIYEDIRNKEKFFNTNKKKILSLICIICLSIILSIELLFFDRKLTKNNVSYRYDVRDRCSYSCWLDHITSLISLGLFCIILIINLIFSCKINYILKKIENIPTEDNKETPLKIKETDEKDALDEEKRKIRELKLLRIKCLIYNYIIFILWIFISIYRIMDDIFMYSFDNSNDPEEGGEDEKTYFSKHSFIQFLMQFLLVIYSLLSSLRGILYGLSFIILEEEIFSKFIRRTLISWIKDNHEEIDDEGGKIIRSTNISGMSDSYQKKKDEENAEKDED